MRDRLLRSLERFMITTRETVLRAIRTIGKASINTLARELSLSPVAVRHHVTALQAEGLITASEERHGVGRPLQVYSLTQAALERFPARYIQFSDRLLAELKTSLAPDALEAMFERMAETVTAEHRARLAGKPVEEKLPILIEILGQEGFMARWNSTGELISLIEYNCPYVHIGQRHPEVCQIDEAIIRRVLDADIQKTTCVLTGGEHCEFVVRPTSDKPAAVPQP
jgi:predicted ArsR family transcriptional regulator